MFQVSLFDFDSYPQRNVYFLPYELQFYEVTSFLALVDGAHNQEILKLSLMLHWSEVDGGYISRLTRYIIFSSSILDIMLLRFPKKNRAVAVAHYSLFSL